MNDEQIIDFTIWLQDNYSQNKKQGDYKNYLPKGYMREDFTNDIYSIEDIYKNYLDKGLHIIPKRRRIYNILRKSKPNKY